MERKGEGEGKKAWMKRSDDREIGGEGGWKEGHRRVEVEVE